MVPSLLKLLDKIALDAKRSSFVEWITSPMLARFLNNCLGVSEDPGIQASSAQAACSLAATSPEALLALSAGESVRPLEHVPALAANSSDDLALAGLHGLARIMSNQFANTAASQMQITMFDSIGRTRNVCLLVRGLEYHFIDRRCRPFPT